MSLTDLHRTATDLLLPSAFQSMNPRVVRVVKSKICHRGLMGRPRGRSPLGQPKRRPNSGELWGGSGDRESGRSGNFGRRRKWAVDSVVLEDGRVIKTDSVVLALGPWTCKLDVLSSLFRVYGLRPIVLLWSPKMGVQYRPTRYSLLIMLRRVGSHWTLNVHMRDVSNRGGARRSRSGYTQSNSVKMLKRVAKNVSTHFKEGEAQVTAEQACFLPSTDDGMPIIGELPGMKGCFVATGHSCWGILNGPATGAALAELVMDGKSSIVDLSSFSPARFAGSSRRH
ncbi:putative oxidoreductase TDA3 [Bienertia sinuspersici]